MEVRPDFPFYNGLPVAVEGQGWLLLLGSVALAFATLVLLPLQGFPLNLIPALLFLAIPLVALRLVAGRHWVALFRPVGLLQIGQMVLFALLTIGGSLLVGLVLVRLIPTSDNPISEAIGRMGPAELAMLLIPTLPQLIGEELLGILPFLAVLWFCVSRLHLSRGAGIGIALLVSALVFGAAHLPTYDWHWGQALIGIGAARIFLTLAYIATRNLWVSAGAHILNDWTDFLSTFAAGHVPIGTDP